MLETEERRFGGEWLARKDSNLEIQNQNLTCYHYTTGEQF